MDLDERSILFVGATVACELPGLGVRFAEDGSEFIACNTQIGPRNINDQTETVRSNVVDKSQDTESPNFGAYSWSVSDWPKQTSDNTAETRQRRRFSMVRKSKTLSSCVPNPVSDNWRQNLRAAS